MSLCTTSLVLAAVLSAEVSTVEFIRTIDRKKKGDGSCGLEIEVVRLGRAGGVEFKAGAPASASAQPQVGIKDGIPQFQDWAEASTEGDDRKIWLPATEGVERCLVDIRAPGYFPAGFIVSAKMTYVRVYLKPAPLP